MTDKDTLATEIFAELMSSYPLNASSNFYVKDTCFISGLLIKHLRNTYITDKALNRNCSFFRSFIKTIKYQSRTGWLNGITEALDCYFPIKS